MNILHKRVRKREWGGETLPDDSNSFPKHYLGLCTKRDAILGIFGVLLLLCPTGMSALCHVRKKPAPQISLTRISHLYLCVERGASKRAEEQGEEEPSRQAKDIGNKIFSGGISILCFPNQHHSNSSLSAVHHQAPSLRHLN